MTVGGRQIGTGTAASKEKPQHACYLGVTQYLEACDAELWPGKVFVESNPGKNFELHLKQIPSGQLLPCKPTHFIISSDFDIIAQSEIV